MKCSVFSFPSWTSHLHKFASSLYRSGWLVWWLCKASLRPSLFPMFFCIISDLFIIRIIVRDDVNASVFSCRVQFGLFFCPFDCGFRLWALWHVCPFFWPSVSRSCSNLFLCQFALNPLVSFWWIFVEQRESRHTDTSFWQWLVSIHACSNNHRSSALDVHENHIFVSLSKHQNDSEVSENGPPEHGVSSVEEKCFDVCDTHSAPSQASHSSEDCSCNSFLRLLTALYTAVDIGCPSCNLARFLHGKRIQCPPLLIWIFWREFQMVAFVLRSSIYTIQKSPVQRPSRVQAVSLEYSWKNFWCQTDAVDLAFCADLG